MVSATHDSTVTAVAHPNIALIKYWGKRDEEYALPYSDSLSVTLDSYPTTTTVRTHAGTSDRLILNGAPATGEALRRVQRFLELVRARTDRTEHVIVETVNTVPTGAGLASSSSGFAALTLAAAGVYGLDSDPVALSALARRGSGSACRSIYGGFSIWYAGTGQGAEGDRHSYARPLAASLDLALVIAVVETSAKPISSREAMRRTVATSPLYGSWLASSRHDLTALLAAIDHGDVEMLGEIAERNALGMHATMLAARPAVRYLSGASHTVLDEVCALRRAGIGAYATVDAGPNVKVICRRSAAESVATALRGLAVTREVIVTGPGPAAGIVEKEPR
ncbi:diphosphomevalonate decarboxylase [Nocardia sp. CDC159]|uniref:diphosphomevalonate decarboxylase n=1 Tax=Nocardia pulmonis TaxID=2951408 RepID=A0A9X2EFR6_9NOCA|nr:MULTISPECIES: diphosphomevalonate decarboxylase [Nocardia]MCM6778680.1 diphosphomevalonate decarboxylase [Nocardia pulmonis]MCM6791569.1 diphosphomevalonate decarboxylase [Nocardia sp. CDC159]